MKPKNEPAVVIQTFRLSNPEPSPFAGRYRRVIDSGIIFPEETMAKEAHKEECDVNTIVKRAARNGILPSNGKEPLWGDFAESVDYQEAMELVLYARQQFDSLPSEVRDRFSNDPARFLDFVNNPENGPEIVRMGLGTLRDPDATPVATPPLIRRTCGHPRSGYRR